VRVPVIGAGRDPLDLRREPRRDPPQEVGPVRRAAAGLGGRPRLAGRRAEGGDDGPLAAPPVVAPLLGPLGRPGRALAARSGLGVDGPWAGVALGRLRPPLVAADDAAPRRRCGGERLDGPRFSAQSGSTRSPNPVS
jgi:hypothetical protein